MGNYTTKEIDPINPLGIPDSHFEQYGLNEAKTVIQFKCFDGIDKLGIMFVIPKTGGGYSYAYSYPMPDRFHLAKGKTYYYVKNVGYIMETSNYVKDSIQEKYFAKNEKMDN